jgi:hypothetical protein
MQLTTQNLSQEVAALRELWVRLDWRARNPRNDARDSTLAAIERDQLTLTIADLEEKIRHAAVIEMKPASKP